MANATISSSIRSKRSATWVPEGFNFWIALMLGAMFLFQVLLVPQMFGSVRTPLRIATFASSMGMLLVVPGRIQWNVAATFGAVLTGILCIQLLNPYNNSLLASLATIGLNFSILSPVFWCSKLKLEIPNFRFLLLCVWFFNASSSCLGILEVISPAQFSRESKITNDLEEDFKDALKVTLADGTSVYRPMGLTDSPGGAAGSGYTTILLATGLLLQKSGVLVRIPFALSIIAGLFCIYLSQVRSLLVLVAVCEIAILGLLASRGQIARITGFLIVFPALIAIATVWAFTVGGEQVWNRISTLTESSAGNVYYANRGTFLEYTIFEALPEYPLGAGLGRWGMVNQYFGDRSSAAISKLWVEIQPTAWVFDGGLMLLVVYYLALAICISQSLRIAIYKSGAIADYATVVAAFNFAMLVSTFGQVPFIGQAGLVFWIINGAFFALDGRSRFSSDRFALPT